MQGTTLPSGTQFVPMIYAASDATTANLKSAKSYNTGIVLGFNEPNEASQADNTVAVGAVPSLDRSLGKQGCLRKEAPYAINADGVATKMHATYTKLATAPALSTDVLVLIWL